MSPFRWFLFCAGAGAILGIALLFEPKVARGTITLGDPTVG
jgi:hypothetical protein